MKIVVLNREQVKASLNMADVLSRVEAAYRLKAAGEIGQASFVMHGQEGTGHKSPPNEVGCTGLSVRHAGRGVNGGCDVPQLAQNPAADYLHLCRGRCP
jgi:hypothetical protein